MNSALYPSSSEHCLHSSDRATTDHLWETPSAAALLPTGCSKLADLNLLPLMLPEPHTRATAVFVDEGDAGLFKSALKLEQRFAHSICTVLITADSVSCDASSFGNVAHTPT